MSGAIRPLQPIRDLLLHIEETLDASIKGNICTPVLYYLYFSNISDEKRDLLNIAYEDFIESLQVEKPSEHYSKISNLNDSEVFFLRYVCIQSIMDISSNFITSDELSSERLRILNILKNVENIQEIELIEDEVNSILTTTIINKSTVGIEKSKIHVDVDKLKQEKYSYYNEIFRTYKMTKTGKSIDGDGLFEYKLGDEDALLITDKKDSVLMKLITTYMIDFSSDSDFGLSKYLCADIRHGFFVNQLRARADSLYLVTEKTNEVYDDNKHWLSKYDFVSNRILNKINECLKQFSEKYDEILLSGKSKIDVTLNSEDKGRFFYYGIEHDEFLLIKQHADNSDDFSGFYDYIESFTWGKTEGCLKNVRSWLYDDFLPSLEDCFEELIVKLKSAKSGIIMNELDEAIGAAKNGLKDDVAVIFEWFSRGDELQLEKLKMNHAIETSINSFTALHSPKTVHIKYYEDIDSDSIDCYLDMNEYKNLILALITAYNNGLEYGVNTTNNPISVSYSPNKNGGWKILVSNLCEKKVKDDYLELIKVSLFSPKGKNKNLVTGEGGTGLYKIKDLMEQRFVNSSIDFSINKENIFSLALRNS